MNALREMYGASGSYLQGILKQNLNRENLYTIEEVK
jgi:hypothetical protein